MDFEPLWWCRGGHRMTIVSWARPRRFARLPPSERRFFAVGKRAFVLADCHWQADRAASPLLVAVHGVEASSGAHYMKGLAEKAWRLGFSVVRLNLRSCGGTEHLSPGLYHSGLTSDTRAVVEELIARDRVPAVVLAGYSLGGNIVLKLAGEYGANPPTELIAACAVSPPIDLASAVVMLDQRVNRIYRWNFLWNLKRRIHRKRAVFPDRFSTRGLHRVRSLRRFDDLYTAPDAGFRDALEYYEHASPMHVVARICIPTFILSSLDDPFIPPEPFRDPRLAGNSHITVLLTEHGGHCGFLTEPCADHDGYWAEWKVVEFAREALQGRHEMLADQREAG